MRARGAVWFLRAFTRVHGGSATRAGGETEPEPEPRNLVPNEVWKKANQDVEDP